MKDVAPYGTLDFSDESLDTIKALFEQEGLPLPEGLESEQNDEDVALSDESDIMESPEEVENDEEDTGDFDHQTPKGAVDSIDGIEILGGKVGGKIPVEEFKTLRKISIKNPDADTFTFGRFTPTIVNGVEDWTKPGPDSYIARAGKDLSYFDLGAEEWGRIQRQYNLSDDEMFKYFNKPALYDAISSGKAIRFSHDPRSFDKGFLVDEWECIKESLKLTDNNLIKVGGFWYVQ